MIHHFVILSTLLVTQTAWAQNSVNIDLNGYIGQVSVRSQDGTSYSDTNLSLSAGQYEIRAGIFDVAEFSVDEAGMVSSAATNIVVEDNSIRLLTTPLTIDPNGFAGRWYVDSVDNARAHQGAAVRAYDLLVGVRYRVGLAHRGRVDFVVGANNSATSLNPGLTVDGNTLLFNTQEVVVDAGLYQGDWFVAHANVGRDEASSYLVANQNYYLTLSDKVDIPFSLDASGNVQSTHLAVTASGATLTLKNVAITFDVDGYKGIWSFLGVYMLPQDATIEEVVLVPHVPYTIRVGAERMTFEMNEASEATLTENAESLSFESQSETLSFNTSTYLVTSPTTGNTEEHVLIAGIENTVTDDSGTNHQVEVPVTCDSDPAEMSNELILQCQPPAPTLGCDFQPIAKPKSCKQKAYVKTQAELDQFLASGLGQSHRLVIGFDLEADSINIQSACGIKIAKKVSVKANNLCLSSYRRVKLGRKTNVSADHIGLYSERNVVIGKKSQVSAQTLEIFHGKKYKMKKKAVIDATEVLINNSPVLY